MNCQPREEGGKSLVVLSAEAFVKALLHRCDTKPPLYVLDDLSHSTIQLVLEAAKQQSWPLATNALFLRALCRYSVPRNQELDSGDSCESCLWKVAYETLFRRCPLPPSIRGSPLQSSDLWFTAYMQTTIQRNLDYVNQHNVPGEPVCTKELRELISRMGEFLDMLPKRSVDLTVRRSNALNEISLSKVLCQSVCGIDASDSESDLSKANIVPSINFFPGLTRLCLRNVKLRSAGLSALIDALCSSTASSTIASLNISNCSLGVTDACKKIVKLPECCPNIRHLDISTNPLHDTGISAIASAFSGSNMLRTLDVTGCNCSSKGLLSLSSLLSKNVLRLYVGANKGLYCKSKLSTITEMFSAFGNIIAKRTVPVLSLDISGEEPITSARIAELSDLGKEIPPLLGTAHIGGLLNSLKKINVNKESFSALHKLTLDGVPLAQDAVGSIVEAVNRGGLRVLSVSGCCLSVVSIKALFGAVSTGNCSVLNISGNKPVPFPIESLIAALTSPMSELARLNIGSCGISDRQAQHIFSTMATHGKSLVSLMMPANNFGPGCDTELCNMLSQNNTLTELDLSENNFSFSKLPESLQCSNRVLSKLDISNNPRAKSSILDFVCDNLCCLTHIRALRRSAGTSKLWNNSTVKLLKTHPTIEDVVVSCPSIQAIKPITEFLCGETSRPTPLRLYVNVGYDSAFYALQKVSQMNTLTELVLICSYILIPELSKQFPSPCGTRVRFVPTYISEMGFPTWSQYPLPPYPLIYSQNSDYLNNGDLYRPPEKKICIK